MTARVLRWLLVVAGGMLLGAGLFLHGQVQVAEYMRAEARNTFFLWRGVGRMSFMLQDSQTQLALWLDDLDPEVLDHSRHAACAMFTLGGLIVLAAPWMHVPRRRRAKKPAAAGR